MPIVNICPKSKSVENVLDDSMSKIRERLKGTICRISGFPKGDVLVNLLACPFRDVDPDSADIVLFIDTCPHEELEAKSDELCRDIADDLTQLGFTVGRGTEIWARFLPGPWYLVKYGKIVESVPHPRV